MVAGSGRVPGHRRRIGSRREVRSIAAHVFGVQTLWTLLHFELDDGSIVKRTVTVHLDGGVMHKDILAGIPLDEAVTLGGVKPLDCAFFLFIQHEFLS